MIISAINIKNIGISICELSIVGSVRIGAIDKVMIVAIDIKSYRNMQGFAVFNNLIFFSIKIYIGYDIRNDNT